MGTEVLRTSVPSSEFRWLRNFSQNGKHGKVNNAEFVISNVVSEVMKEV